MRNMSTERSRLVQFLSLLQLVMLVASQVAAPPPTSGPIPAPVVPATVPARIDTHSHYVPPFYKALLDSRNIISGGRPIPAWNATAHLELNARLGIQTSVVAVSTPGAVLSENAPVEEGRTLARRINVYGHQLTVDYPKKFLFWATLTLPDLDGAVAEAIYALDALGAAGVIIEASAFGELLGSPRWAPLYKVLNDRSAVVFVHPSSSPCADAPIFSPNSTDLPPFVVDFLLDTTRAALNLVYKNVTTDYPNITFILAHSGGFLPFAVVRAAGGLALLSGNAADQTNVITKLQKFYVDLAISGNPFALPSTTALFDVSHITFGSDYPYAGFQGIQKNTANIESFGFRKAARRKINYRNAYGLFKRLSK